VKKSNNNVNEGVDLSHDDLSHQDRSLIQSVLNRGATRRQALKMLMASGISAAAAGSILTYAGQAIASTPTKGGHVKMSPSLHGPNDTFDPAMATSDIDYCRHRGHYNSLIQLNDDITPRGELAEEFSANSNATEWTFKLRKDV